MRVTAIPGLDPDTYRPHALHGADSTWPETNCYADLWIGVLNALGLDPHAMLPFCFAADFEGDQWTFLKPSPDDLWTLYGIDVQELNVWDMLAEHVREQVRRGNLPLVEVDSFYLPDTQGTAYRREHKKTTIGVNALDFEGERLDYFHNGGYYALAGENLRGVLRIGDAASVGLDPYAEFAKLGRIVHLPPNRLREASLAVALGHFGRRPRQNPLSKYRERLAAEAECPLDSPERYHRRAFATVRQLGAAFQMASVYLHWLEAQRPSGLCGAAAAFEGISEGAKALLFKMARAANTGRPLQYETLTDKMEADWQAGFDALADRLGGP